MRKERAMIEGVLIVIATNNTQGVHVCHTGNVEGTYSATYRSEQQTMWTDQQKLERDVEKLQDLGPYLQKRGFKLE